MPFNIENTNPPTVHNDVQNNHLRCGKFPGIKREIHPHARGRELTEDIKKPRKHRTRRAEYSRFTICKKRTHKGLVSGRIRTIA